MTRPGKHKGQYDPLGDLEWWQPMPRHRGPYPTETQFADPDVVMALMEDEAKRWSGLLDRLAKS